jgi:hypothetical protein
MSTEKALAIISGFERQFSQPKTDQNQKRLNQLSVCIPA